MVHIAPLWIAMWLHASVGSQYIREASEVAFKGQQQVQRNILVASLVPILFLFLLLPKEDTGMRGVFSMAAVFYFIRAVEANTYPEIIAEDLSIRIMHVGVTFTDSRKRTPVAEKDRYKRTVIYGVNTVVHGTLFFIAVRLIYLVQILKSPALRYAVGSFAGCLYILESLEMMDSILNLLTLQFGFEIYPIMKNPLKSTSIREFWARRWDTAIQGILKDHVYDNMRYTLKADRTSSAIMTFVASGMIHINPLIVAGMSAKDATRVMGYFLVQCLLTAVEPSLIPKKTPRHLKRTWLVACLLVPAPLIMAPSFRLAGLDM